MTENEAIERLKCMRLFMQINDKENESKFLEDDYAANETAIKALEEIQKYRSLGTIEELREAMEKQRAKKPIWKPYEWEDESDPDPCCDWHCPTCGKLLTDRIPANNKDFYFHCLNCGQKFDWS